MCKFSIIIPCYNSEKRINRLLETLSTDKYFDYEVVFVDDSSTDNTYNLLYSKKDLYRNYYVYRMKKNSGPGPARNYGIEKAHGEYILFCDSDDEFDIECLIYIDMFLSKHSDADMLVFPHMIVRGGRQIKNDTYSLYENCSIVLPKDIANGCAGPIAKVFKKTIINENNITFPSRMTGEDACFVVNYAACINKAYKLDKVYYKYIMNKQSVTHTINDDINMDTTFDILQPIYHNCFPEIEIEQFVNGHLLTRAKQMCAMHYSTHEIKKWYEEENKRYPDWIKEISYKEQSIYRKLIYKAMYNNNPLLIKLIMLLRRVIY